MSLTGSSITRLDSVDSTNNYAMAKVHAGLAKHGDAWFSTDQTAGKGRNGKIWQMARDQNIALSIALEPIRLKAQPFQLSVAVSLGCFDFFFSYAGEGTAIKWPNDIYWRDRKAGGVLIENIFQGINWKYSVIGIGININQTRFDDGLKNPVSLKQITGKDFNLSELAKELYRKIIKRAEDISIKSLEELLAEYNQHLYGKNKRIQFKKDNMIFETLVKGVTAQGRLLTVDATTDREFDFGEIEWLP